MRLMFFFSERLFAITIILNILFLNILYVFFDSIRDKDMKNIWNDTTFASKKYLKLETAAFSFILYKNSTGVKLQYFITFTFS